MELEKLEAENLKATDKLKTHFFANVSHEFRTPLTLILGQIDSVLKEDKPEKRRTRLEMAQRNAKRLMQLINQLRERFSTATVIRPTEVSAISQGQIFLEKVIAAIEAHMEDEQFSVSALADIAAMSVNHLNRKLQALINQPAGQLVRSMRLQRAADLLAQGAANVSEIAYQMGFSSPANFARSFKNQFGCSPSEYISSSRDKG